MLYCNIDRVHLKFTVDAAARDGAGGNGLGVERRGQQRIGEQRMLMLFSVHSVYR